VIQKAFGLDGGGALAADALGDVYVVWHAPEPGKEGEGNRRVWMARSIDDGKTFAPERPAYGKPTGACGCCGLDAFADRSGTLYVLYRIATEMVHRDMYLLVSRDKGETFQGEDISKWNVGYCVMSSEAFVESPAGVLAAWETEKQAYCGRIDPATGRMSVPVGAPGTGENRKYPAVAVNAQARAFSSGPRAWAGKQAAASRGRSTANRASPPRNTARSAGFPPGAWWQPSRALRAASPSCTDRAGRLAIRHEECRDCDS
jgi:hypothetical protein